MPPTRYHNFVTKLLWAIDPQGPDPFLSVVNLRKAVASLGVQEDTLRLIVCDLAYDKHSHVAPSPPPPPPHPP